MTWLLVNPVSLGPFSAFWALSSGIHIAQFRCQVIGNCGVIHLPQCNDKAVLAPFQVPPGVAGVGIAAPIAVGGALNMTVSWQRGPVRIGSAV